MELEVVVATLRKCNSTSERLIAFKAFLDNHRLNYVNCSKYTSLSEQSALAKLINTVHLPADECCDTPVNDEAFAAACKYARLVCNFLHGSITKLGEHSAAERKSFFTKLAPDFIKLCAPLQRHINNWCDEETEHCSGQVMGEMLELVEYRNVKQALDDRDLQIFRGSLDLILPFLTREKWKESCAAKSVFIHIVTNTSGDVLTENLDMILPFTLIMTDDFVPGNAVLGIECMNHIMNEVPPAELRLRGRADVLHDAISRKLYTREPMLAEALVPCVLQSLRCIEPVMMRKRGCRIPKHDACFDTILNSIHLSSDTLVKRVFVISLPLFISSMGIQCISHMRTLLMVLEYGFETSDLITVKHFASAVVELVNSAWPRLIHHCEKLLGMLVKTLYSIANDEWRRNSGAEKDQAEAAESITKAVAKLAFVSKDVVEETINMLAEEETLGLQKQALKVRKLILYEGPSMSDRKS